MNNDTDKLEFTNHNILINDRQSIQINGVTKIESFDNEEFLIDTVLGKLGIKGENLEIIKLDTYEGVITIKGLIYTLSYLDDKRKKDNTMIERLFK